MYVFPTWSSSQHGCALLVRGVLSVVSYLLSNSYISHLSFDLCLFHYLLGIVVWNYRDKNGGGNIRANIYAHGCFSNKQAKVQAVWYGTYDHSPPDINRHQSGHHTHADHPY